MPRYQLTVTAETLQELTGALTEAAAMLQAGDASNALAAELAPLAAAAMADSSYGPAPDNGAYPTGLPTPAPDYAATGLTDWQALQARQAQPAPVYVPPAQAVAVLAPAPVATADNPPQCRLGHGVMVWKGGGISKNGKGLPLWSCQNAQCREAIWPPKG